MQAPTPAPPAQALDPREELPWFKRLPERTRAEIVRDWRKDAARNVELDKRVRKRVVLSSVKMSALFAFADFASPSASPASFAMAIAIGALLGAASERLNADRLTTGAVGLSMFIMLQWLSRSDLTLLHVLILFPFSALCAYLGYVREERDWI